MALCSNKEEISLKNSILVDNDNKYIKNIKSISIGLHNTGQTVVANLDKNLKECAEKIDQQQKIITELQNQVEQYKKTLMQYRQVLIQQ